MKLYKRLIEASLRAALKDTPAVCVLGPRQAGKSTLVRMLEPDYAYVTFDDAAALAFARSDPTGFVAALPERVILDEVQRVPDLLRTIKFSVDQDRRPGRFVLTGSANLMLLPDLGDSLAGRMEVLQLQPLTAAEMERHPGRFLEVFMEGGLKPQVNPSKTAFFDTLASRIVSGGFPEAVARTPTRARAWHRAYLRTLIERDVREVARVRDASALSRLEPPRERRRLVGVSQAAIGISRCCCC
ncbi:MAG: AAA family ATPase [Rudaea sp.]|uniref:ATP-binding protein n=1 Tax=Rudaea sp. TaxID=2136325 RepID=UPI0039E2211A